MAQVNDTEELKEKKEDKQEKAQFYASDDSDNESDFEVLYEQVPDNYEDVAALTGPQQPLYLTDCLLGLRSDDHRRYDLAISALPKLVEE